MGISFVRVITSSILAVLSPFTSLDAQTGAPAKSTPRPRVVIVELFTSEGCSSCPPADILLKKINGRQTAAGQLIVGISEHVTYWNSLGWSDPFSSQIYTDRQNAYGAHFGLDSVYTPQMVVNGSEQFVGSDGGHLTQALRKEQDQHSTVDLQILSTSITDRILTVNFSASSDNSPPDADLIVVLTDDMDQSSVLNGENSGRTLTHVSVARSISRLAGLQIATGQKVRITLPDSIRAPQGHHVILFAQLHDGGRILSADSEPL
jgi:hypothetical protein